MLFSGQNTSALHLFGSKYDPLCMDGKWNLGDQKRFGVVVLLFGGDDAGQTQQITLFL